MKKRISFIVITVFFAIVAYSAPKPDYELISGNLKLKVFRKTGNFCLYSLLLRGKDNYMPLYDERSLGRDNKFYVFLNGKSYELKKRIGRPVKIEQADNVISVVFHLKDKVYVTQKLSFTTQTYGTSGPILKIETTIENITGKEAEIALKALFDTYLGEDRRVPIYTDVRTGIFNETILEPKFEKDSAVISANKDVACIFLVKHTDATPLDNIYIANWSRLQSIKWLPQFIPGRSFSTKYFHNDSAVLFVWPKQYIDNKETTTTTMLIGYYDYMVRNKSVSKNEEIQTAKPVEPKPPETKVLPEPVDTPPENMTKEELKDYTYIKKLLDKIAEVETSPDEISDDYINDLTKQADNAINDIQE